MSNQVVLTKSGNIVTANEYTATSRPYLPYCTIEHKEYVNNLSPNYQFEYLFQGYDGDTIFDRNKLAQTFITSDVLSKSYDTPKVILAASLFM